MLGKLWNWMSRGGSRSVSVRDPASADPNSKMQPVPSDEEDNLVETLIPARAKVDRPKKEEVRNSSFDTFVAHDDASLRKALADAEDRVSPCDTISADEFFRK
jgi:hypothetical protein